MSRSLIFVFVFFTVTFVSVMRADAQTTEFTYQGSLKDNAAAANGSYDFEFRLFDALAAGNQIGLTIPRNGVAVANGIFTVQLNFGAQFPGAARFLQIATRPAGGPSYTTLAPRQSLSSAPYAVKSLNADNAANATNALQLGGVAANQFVVTTDPRMTDARAPTAGSANYVQNTTVQQAASNFNISGTGTANVLSVTSEYRFGNFRVLSTLGTRNLFAGIGAGAANTSGSENTFLGTDAGTASIGQSQNVYVGYRAGSSAGSYGGNTFVGANAGRLNVGNAGVVLSHNSFFGSSAGESNDLGYFNSFFGNRAGFSNTQGSLNSFFGQGAGNSNTSGSLNSFFGQGAGSGNTTSSSNSFFGQWAGLGNGIGGSNSFFGRSAGQSTSDGGSGNSFFGSSAGNTNTTGSNNTIIGGDADVGANNLTYAAAIGSGAVVSTSNTIVLGRSGGQDAVQIPGALSVTGTLSGNIVNATTRYNIDGNRVLSVGGTDNVFAGVGAGNVNTGSFNSFFGRSAGLANTTGGSNSFFGRSAGFSNTIGGDNSFFGTSAGLNNTTGGTNSFFGQSAGALNMEGTGNSFFGRSAGQDNRIGDFNSFFGRNAGFNTRGGNNSFFGTSAGITNTTGSNNTIIGRDADVGANNLTYATAIGSDAVVSASNRIQLGRADGSDDVRVSGNLILSTLAASGSTDICRSGVITTFNFIANCSSSLRYKSNVSNFTAGLDIVRRLRPIMFDWIGSGIRDVGFGAEEVEKIEPLLASYNDKGEIEGVKYKQITTVLVNAVKEQQQQIEALKKQIDEQKAEIDALKELVCIQNPTAAVCKEQK